MKGLLLAATAVFILGLTSCEDNAKTTYVSKGLFDKNTIVSTRSGSGYTRTEYGSDFWGNKKITVSQGHQYATEQDDALALGLQLAVGLLEAFLQDR